MGERKRNGRGRVMGGDGKKEKGRERKAMEGRGRQEGKWMEEKVNRG